MIIRRASEGDIRAALDVANMQFEGNLAFRELEDRSGPRVPKFKVRLTVKDLDGPGCRRGFSVMIYGRSDAPRRIRSACYHAVGSFLVSVFERQPDAIIETASSRYRGARRFLLNFASVGEANVGSQFCSMAFEAACNCHEHSTDYIDVETIQYLGYWAHIPSGKEVAIE